MNFNHSINKIHDILCQLELILSSSSAKKRYRGNASVNSSGAHPPGQPQGICSRCQSRGWGISKFYRGQGAGHQHTQGLTPGHLTHVFSKEDKFIGKDRAFVKAKASRRRKAIGGLTCVARITQCILFYARENKSVRAKKSAKLFLPAETRELRNWTTRSLRGNGPLQSSVLV